jgi:hypothetical protein
MSTKSTMIAPITTPIVTAVATISPKRKADSRESILQELYGGVSGGSVSALSQSNERREKVFANSKTKHND